MLASTRPSCTIKLHQQARPRQPGWSLPLAAPSLLRTTGTTTHSKLLCSSSSAAAPFPRPDIDASVHLQQAELHYPGTPLPAAAGEPNRIEPKPAWWTSIQPVHYLCVGLFLVLLIAAGMTSADAIATVPASVTSSSGGKLSEWLGERMLYYLGKVGQMSVAAKVVLVISSTAPFILIFGALYSALTSTEMKAACLKMYALLNRLPGAQVLNEKTLAAAVLVNCVFFIGMFVFAVMLGVVTDEIKTTFKSIRNGRYPLNQTEHLVVLNWNNQAISLLRQVAAGRKAGEKGIFRQPVAVLADIPKAEMDAAISKRLKGLGLEVYTRSGSPTLPGDLATVAAQQASAVIVLSPNSSAPQALGAPGAAQAQAAMALAAACPSLQQQKVVFQAPNQACGYEHVEAFKRLLGARAEGVQALHFSEVDIISRLSVLSSIQPGMARVVMSVLDPAEPSMRVQPVPPQLVGCTYQEARRAFADGILCGYVRGGEVQLLPQEDEVLRADDQAVMLSLEPDVPLNWAAAPVFAQAADAAAARADKGHAYKSNPRQVIVISTQPELVGDLAAVYAELSPKGSTVTFLLPHAPAGGAPAKSGNCTFKYCYPGSGERVVTARTLNAAGLSSATSVMVAGLGNMPAADADAFVVATLLQVQDAARQSGRDTAPHFVAQVQKQSTVSTATTYLKLVKQEADKTPHHTAHAAAAIIRPDLFVADDLLTAVLVQGASQPANVSVVRDLLDSSGAELYFRDPAVFNMVVGDLMTWADVAETARLYGETAVGYLRGRDGALALAPEPTHPLNFQQGDKIIVLAEEFNTAKPKKA